MNWSSGSSGGNLGLGSSGGSFGGSAGGSGGTPDFPNKNQFFKDPLTGEYTWYTDYSYVPLRFTVPPANPKDMVWFSGNKVKMKIVLGLEGPVVFVYDKNPTTFSAGGGVFPELSLALKKCDAVKFFESLNKESNDQFVDRFCPTTESHGNNITTRFYGFVYENHLNVFRVAFETLTDPITKEPVLDPVQIWLYVEAADDFNAFDSKVLAYFCKIISSK
jgi:hypothetical protein